MRMWSDPAGREAGGEQRTLLALSGYYVATGLWAVISPSSFQKVTGPKTDIWLLKAFSLLIAVVGGIVGILSRRSESLGEARFLAISSAATFAGIDVYYSTKGTISKVYLLDAVVQLILGIKIWSIPNYSLKSSHRPRSNP
jgi:hypothetical protein